MADGNDIKCPNCDTPKPGWGTCPECGTPDPSKLS